VCVGDVVRPPGGSGGRAVRVEVHMVESLYASIAFLQNILLFDVICHSTRWSSGRRSFQHFWSFPALYNVLFPALYNSGSGALYI